MHHNPPHPKQTTSFLGIIFQTIIAGIIVGLFCVAVGSLLVASSGEDAGPGEETSRVRQLVEASILGSEASPRPPSGSKN